MTTLERQEVERVGQQMASDSGLAYPSSNAGEYVSGQLTGVVSLVSGRQVAADTINAALARALGDRRNAA